MFIEANFKNIMKQLLMFVVRVKNSWPFKWRMNFLKKLHYDFFRL